MFGIMTFMFVLGIITLVQEIALRFKQVKMQLFLDPTAVDALSSGLWFLFRTEVITATFSRLMVRLHETPIPSALFN